MAEAYSWSEKQNHGLSAKRGKMILAVEEPENSGVARDRVACTGNPLEQKPSSEVSGVWICKTLEVLVDQFHKSRLLHGSKCVTSFGDHWDAI